MDQDKVIVQIVTTIVLILEHAQYALLGTCLLGIPSMVVRKARVCPMRAIPELRAVTAVSLIFS